MTNTTQTNPRNSGASPISVVALVLYNDSCVNRQSNAEEAFTGERMSTTTRESRQTGRVMPAFSRVLSDSCFHEGDPLLEVWAEKMDVDPMAFEIRPKATFMDLCERLFAKLNIAHPDGWSHRSMSTGDVVLIGETAFSCEIIGFAAVDISTSDIR